MKPINQQIAPKLVEKASKLAKYTKILHSTLPAQCSDHVTVSGLQNETLQILADSPVWTTRLRQLGSQIIQNFNRHSPHQIRHIDIKTRYLERPMPSKQKETPLKQSPKISETTAELLTQSAKSIEDQKLKESLLKLASHRPDNKTNQ